jgi:Tol biopolymer transport system component
MPALPNATEKAEQIGNAHDEGWSVEWSGDGKIFTEFSNVIRRAEDGSQKETILAPTAPIDDLAICGNYLVISQIDVATEQVHLVRYDLNGGQNKQLTFQRASLDPNCSPDGKWLAYVSPDAGKSELFRIPIDGGQPKKLSDLHAVLPGISPDGKFIVFRNNEGTNPSNYEHRIAVVPADGGAPVHIYQSDPRAGTSGYENDPRAGIGRTEFTPDGKGIAYAINIGDVGNIWVQPIEGGSLKQMTFFKSGRIDDFAFSHDGKKLALLRGRTNRDVVLIHDKGE